MIANKYQIKSLIGIGGSSRVFSCTNVEGKQSPRSMGHAKSPIWSQTANL